MRRTQIYLDKESIALLDKLAKRTRKNRSELIRQAITKVYDSRDIAEAFTKINGIKSFQDKDLATK